MNTNCYAVIEAGGTKFNCAILDGQRNVLASSRVATTTPEETLSHTLAFFKEQQSAGYHFLGLGVASFGPLDLNPHSPTYGYITATPKPHWSHTPLLPLLSAALQCPVAIDTDVNAAALAEYRWGAGQGKAVVVYVTVGTGVGGGVVIHGRPLHGLVHPEIGHMLVNTNVLERGACPFHTHCVEGFASGAAMRQLWGAPAETFGDDHPAWEVMVEALGQMSHNLLLTLSCERIIFGGGVMQRPGLLERIADYTETSLQGYLSPTGVSQLRDVFTLPGLGNDAGLMGAFALLHQGTS